MGDSHGYIGTDRQRYKIIFQCRKQKWGGNYHPGAMCSQQHENNEHPL